MDARRGGSVRWVEGVTIRRADPDDLHELLDLVSEHCYQRLLREKQQALERKHPGKKEI